MDTPIQKFLVFLLRISMGVVFLFAAYRQIPDPDWTAAGFLGNASLFPAFFAFFTTPEILPIIDAVIPWAHLLIGLGLFLGLGMRLATLGGGVLMFLYYLPRLDGFMVGEYNFIVEYHLVYTIIIFYLAAVGAGRAFGIEGFIASYPKLEARLKRNRFLRLVLF